MLCSHLVHLNAYGDQPPIITMSLAKMIVEFDFAAEDQDDLMRGMHPFAINNGNAEQRRASLLNATKFDMLATGLVGVQLKDLEDLLAKEVKHIPVSYMELETTLSMFDNSVHGFGSSTYDSRRILSLL